MNAVRKSYFEASARRRIAGIADPDSFREICGPRERLTSPSLGYFDAPAAFDDGAVVGEARIDGRPVLLAAQEGKFLGGALGEVHSAKIVGLLRRALRTRPEAVVILADSGGVRLQEANAGEIGATEIIRAVLDVRAAGIPVIGLIGGACGCYGGMGIISCCFDAIIVSEQGRIAVSGPEVIETTMGVDAFDSRDRALVWRTMGGKNRFLFDLARELVEDDIPAFRTALIALLAQGVRPDPEAAVAEREVLAKRFADYGQAKDALDVWRAMGFAKPDAIPGMSAADLTARKLALGKGKA